MVIVNNVTRMLDAKKISYTAFETPPEKLGAIETARFLNVQPGKVYKTVVVARQPPGGSGFRNRGKPILAIVSGTTSVDLKKIANAVNEKKVFLPTEREAEQLTGLQAGGISPLALLNMGFQVIIDESAQAYETIHISGGQRGLNILLPVDALVDLTHARFAKISA